MKPSLLTLSLRAQQQKVHRGENQYQGQKLSNGLLFVVVSAAANKDERLIFTREALAIDIADKSSGLLLVVSGVSPSCQ